MKIRHRAGCGASLAVLATGLLLPVSALAQGAASPAPQTSLGSQSPAAVNATSAANAQSAVQPAGSVGSTSPSSATPNGGFQVDTIVVTAQKRTQNLQDVPIVVTAVGRQLLQDSGVRDIKDLSKLTPGLTVTSSASEASTTARIRGVGTVGDNPGLEPAVGVVIDGVYRPRNGVGFGDLGDVDRIEVLKGPQGTLFGKSTSAGVINIITAQPSFTYGTNAEFTVGNYNAIGGAAEVTGPLVGDKLAGSFYFADRQRDGFYSVDTGQGPRTKDDDQDENFYTVRGQLLYKPDSKLTARLIADYSHRDESCCVAVQKTPAAPLDPRGDSAQSIIAGLGGAGGGEAQVPNEYNRLAYANRPGVQDIIDEGLSLQLDYKLPSLNAALTSISAIRRWKLLNGSDVDFSNADLLYRPDDDSNIEQFDDVTQELRFAGTSGKLDYLIGVFYANEDLRDNYSLLFGSQYTQFLSEAFSATTGAVNPLFFQDLFGPTATFPTGQGSVDRYHQHDDTYAAFTNETVHLTSKLEVNTGLRYTIDNKVLDTQSTNIGTGQGCSGVLSSPLTQTGLIPQAAINVACVPFQSPAYNAFNDHQSQSEKETSGTVKLVYRLDPRILTYFSYAKGFKAGGFNLDRVACPNEPGCPAGPAGVVTALTPETNTSFKPEFSDSFELGAKSTLFDRKLLLNVALFHEKFSDFQFNTFNGIVFVVSSVPYVYSKGIDADFVWRPIRSLTLQGGVTAANTRFSHSDQAVLLNTGYLGAPGARLPFAPQYSSAISATYTYDLPRDYMARFNMGAKYNSDYNTGSDEDPRKVQKAYTVTDARIILGPKDSRYDVELWAENLFDTNYEQTAFNVPGQNIPTNAKGELDAFLGAPRTFGATLRARFQ